jgi:hypothetical protein
MATRTNVYAVSEHATLHLHLLPHSCCLQLMRWNHARFVGSFVGGLRVSPTTDQ